MDINISNNRECFFDLKLTDALQTTAARVFHKPIKQDFCVVFNEKWEKEASYISFFYDEDRYRMYYAACQRCNDDYTGLMIDETAKICYMESFDGINWVKPELNICEFEKSKKNNIILWHKSEFFVFKDTNPNCKDSERYKAVYQSKQNDFSLRCMLSCDGINFKEGWMLTDKGFFDTLNIAFYDNRINKYVCFIRNYHKPDQSDSPDFKNLMKAEESAVRDIRVIYSDDFMNWTTPERLEYKDGKDIPLYTNCISIYNRAPQYYLGFPSRYVERKSWTKSFDALCGKEKRKLRMKIHPRLGLATTDCIFMASRDTKKWERLDEAFIIPGIERESGWLYGDCYPAAGIAETKNKLYGHKELSLYCAEGLWGFECRLARYTMRLDGFVSFHAGNEEKTIVTKPFTFKGGRLFMNLSTSAAGSVIVSILDEKGVKTISGEIFGDNTDKEIWFLNDDLREFEGKPVTMKITLKDSDIYSFQFWD